MKIFVILSLLALAASNASAQFDACTYGQCQQQPFMQPIMNPCNEFVRQQCSPVSLPWEQSRRLQLSSCQVMRQQCCQQMRLMAQQYRCQAICTMVQSIMQQVQFDAGFVGETQAQAQAQVALNLPSMCGVYPRYCSTPCNVATGHCAMKIFVILSLVALAASSTSAQFDACTYGQCQQQPFMQPIMNSCNEFVRQQCSPVSLPWEQSHRLQLSSCQVMRQQCCRQMRLMAQQYGCQAICTMVQAIMQQVQLDANLFGVPQAQAQAQVALNLPSMCGVYPRYCNTPCIVATSRCGSW
uniref:Bifunctional inhibitor/plant lipid transfer protein/seed storage helical domain-containing protein n=1 Tax=Oryza meridionalis TaxID=40149 RepID=A0A0E0E2C5_9ORYZ